MHLIAKNLAVKSTTVPRETGLQLRRWIGSLAPTNKDELPPAGGLRSHRVYGFAPARDRLTIRKRFLQVQDFPGNFSDYTETDAAGRMVQINVCGKSCT